MKLALFFEKICNVRGIVWKNSGFSSCSTPFPRSRTGDGKRDPPRRGTGRNPPDAQTAPLPPRDPPRLRPPSPHRDPPRLRPPSPHRDPPRRSRDGTRSQTFSPATTQSPKRREKNRREQEGKRTAFPPSAGFSFLSNVFIRFALGARGSRSFPTTGLPRRKRHDRRPKKW